MPIVLAGLLSALLTRLQITLNTRLRLTAPPRTDRWHSVPTPSSGGLAIFLSCAVGYAFAGGGQYHRIAVGVVALWVFGFLDDRFRLRPSLKLVAQVAAAAFVVTEGTASPMSWSGLMTAALRLFWIVAITNAFNLIDNMDGLCAGVVVIVCLFRGPDSGITIYGIIGAAFAGFLVSNFHPARIFMGDCGSLPAGFVLAALMLLGRTSSGVLRLPDFVGMALCLAYPIFDVALVSILRTRAGKRFWEGGRDHSSHRLVRMGLSDRQAVGVLWVITALGCASERTVWRWPALAPPMAVILLVAAALFGLFLARTSAAERQFGSGNQNSVPATPERKMLANA